MDRFNLKIADIIQETADTKTIVFETPRKARKYLAGQFLTIILNLNGKEERRSYSLSSSPQVDKQFAVTVKRVQGGLVSNHIIDNFKVGQEVDCLSPMGNFTVEAQKRAQHEAIFFAAGSGITPVISMVKTLLNGEKFSKISLIYSNRNEESIIFKEELAAMKAKFGIRFKLIHVLSRPAENWNGLKGRVDKFLVPRLLDQLPVMAPKEANYYMCGPEEMMDAIREGLGMVDVPKNQIHQESFTAAVAATADSSEVANAGGAAKVSVDYRGELFTFEAKVGDYLLESAMKNDIEMPFRASQGFVPPVW